MLDKTLNISVLIAGRPYKLRVLPEEESIVRQAAKELNEKVQEYQDQFFNKDKQDFLAMIALQLKVDAIKKMSSNGEGNEWSERLDALDLLLTSGLQGK